MRTLTWFMDVPPLGASGRESYRMDGSYTPVRAWVHCEQAPAAEEVVFDITADGVSLFAYALRIQDSTDEDENDFSSVQISKDTIVSLAVTSRGGNPGSGVTVGLELEDA